MSILNDIIIWVTNRFQALSFGILLLPGKILLRLRALEPQHGKLRQEIYLSAGLMNNEKEICI